jgi:hypothetical protein
MICREIVDEIRGVLSKAIVHPRSFRGCEHRNASSPEPFSNSEQDYLLDEGYGGGVE